MSTGLEHAPFGDGDKKREDAMHAGVENRKELIFFLSRALAHNQSLLEGG